MTRTLTLSPRAAELVRAFQQRPGLASRLIGRRLDPSALAALEQLGDPLVAPLLLPYVIDGDAQTRVRVAGVIRELMRAVSPMEIIELDHASRSWRAYEGIDRSDWYSVSASDVRQIALLADSTSTLGVATFHSSGHVRAAAVQQLDARGGDDALPYLLVRVNDWVTPVAEYARAAVVRRTGFSPATWVVCLPLVVRLMQATRREHTEVVNAVFAFLRQPASRLALEIGCAAPDRGTRRVSFRLAREGAGDDLATVIARAYQDHDPIVRFEALRDAAERLDDASLGSVLNGAAYDTFAPIRRAALLVAEGRIPAEVLERSKRALLDRSPSVRELARFLVAKYDQGLAVVDVYRALVRSGTSAAVDVALAGLAETGSASDASRVTPFLTHRRAAIRAQAIRTLGRLSADTAADTFLTALSDPSPRVTHAARDVLQQHADLIDYGTVASAVRSSPHAHTRLDALRLGDALGWWPSLILSLEAAGSVDDALAHEACERVKRWIQRANRCFVAPKPGEIGELQELVGRPRGQVTADMRAEIRACLRPWLNSA